ncbi:hypothetical protein PIB30_089389 [Stylosanthes scabra]|uniref:Uncharacterized protein n=1 Tax=Stylosanthes scabra TaxID=79078 RepID=A0ABU6SVJ5_9FABA|nr:hypothetical protein [Stylosanthes scabra]
MPTSNANEVTVERAILIHSIMEGLSIKAELLISKHISATAESKDPNKRLPFTGVIYRLLYANGFKKKVQGDELIPIKRPITAESIMKNSQQFPPQVHHQVHEERDQQEQHFQPPPQQYDFPQPPTQNFPQEYNWQELTQQFQGMRVEQNNQFKDFFDRHNSFFEEMRTQTKAYKQGFEDLRVQQHKYVDEIKASQEITHKAVLELRENQYKHDKELAAHRKEYKKDYKEMKAAMEKQKKQFETANQYWHQLNIKTEQKIDYLCWGNVQAGRGRFSDGMSHILRDCWPAATSRGAASASKNVEDKGKGSAEEGDNDERGKKKAWEARDKDLNIWALETPKWALEMPEWALGTPCVALETLVGIENASTTLEMPKSNLAPHFGALKMPHWALGRTRHRPRVTVPRPLRAPTRTSLALGRARSVAPRGCSQATRVAATRPILGRAPSLGQNTSRYCPTQGRTRHRPRETVPRPLCASTRTSLVEPLALGRERRVVAQRGGARGTVCVKPQPATPTTCPELGRAPSLGQSTSRCCPSRGARGTARVNRPSSTPHPC